jgi:hypothetical protein
MSKPKKTLLSEDQKLNSILAGLFVLLIVSLVTVFLFVRASPDIELTQQINAGTLTTDVLDASRVSVANPSFAISSTTFSFDCQVVTGTLGSSSQRLYVINPSAATNGWTLTIASTSGETSRWQNAGNTRFYDYNDSAGSTAGCSDGADADSIAGQLTLNPAAGTLTQDCASCTTSNISLGSQTAFVQGTTSAITLLNAAAASDDAGRWYLTGVGMSQRIPAEQQADSYSFGLTITVTAS